MHPRRAITLGLLVAMLLAVLAGVLACQRDLAQARARTANASRLVGSPYGSIEYAVRGQGVPLLMIHGSGGGFDQGLDFSARLAGAGVRTIAPSRFGYLRSGYPRGATPQMQADALDHLLGRLGEAKVVIVGGSAGALSAAQLALRHPERCAGLVLLVPAMYAPDRPPGENAAPGSLAWRAAEAMLRSDALFWAGLKLAPDQLTRMLLATDPALVRRASAAEQRRVREALKGILPVSRRQDGLALDMATAGNPPRYPLERLSCPVLAISARDDLYGTAKAAADVARRAPQARLILYPIGGHMLVGHDAEVWREIAAFAGRVAP